jgi:hypothetical protein
MDLAKDIVDFAFVAAEIRGRSDWLSRLEARQKLDALPKDALKQFDGLLPRMRQELKHGRAALTLAACRTAWFCAPEKFLSLARRRGVFRSSKINYNGNGLSWLVDRLADDAFQLALPSSAVSYLRSVSNLMRLSASAQEVRRSIITEARKARPYSLLKSCFVFVDRAFRPAADHLPSAEESAADWLGDPERFSPEQKASGLSTLLATLGSIDMIDGFDMMMVHESAVIDGTCERVLLAASVLSELAQAEVLLDNFPYECVIINEKRNEVHVRSVDPNLEKSIQLGYAQSTMQTHIVRMASDQIHLDHPSLTDMADRFSKELGHLIVTRAEHPVDRYVMQLPLLPALKRIVLEDAHYKEEVAFLSVLAKESYADSISLWDLEVVDGLKVKHLMLLSRFFLVMSRIFFDALDRPAIAGDRDILDMRSRLPVYKEDAISMLCRELFGEFVAAKLLDVLVYDLVRNTLYEQSTRLLVGKGTDPMQLSVAKALESRGFKVVCDVKIKPRSNSGTTRGDIDVLAYRDGLLLVLECKNTFHPCSPHEMRSTWDNMTKAGFQLTKAAAWFHQPGVLKNVFDAQGWGSPNVEHIRTAVVSALRIFSGYEIQGHPIRQARELMNVITTGVVHFSSTERYRLWKSEEFSVEDLLAYLDGAIVIKERFDSAVEGRIEYKLGAKGSLFVSSYGLDTKALAERITSRYVRLDPEPSGSLPSPEESTGV